MSSFFKPWSRAFVGNDNTSLICLAFHHFSAGFSTVLFRYFAKQCCKHRNFQLSTSGFHCELEFFIVWFNKESLSIVWRFRALVFRAFFAASDMNHVCGDGTLLRTSANTS